MISVIIPALNEEKFLSDCLESLINQDYEGEYEIIVVDNGSTDNTANIARNFGAKVVPCSERKCVSYVRQVGADVACGDIIAQADADTVYPRDWLTRIADHFYSHPDTVAVAGRFIYRDPPSWAKFEYFLRDCANRLAAALFGRPFLVSGATFAFRRKAFLNVDGYEVTSYSSDQYGISSRLSKTGKVSYDRNLCILTSSRSVRKPLFLCIMEALVHISHWGTYMCKCYVNSFERFANKTTLRRVTIRLSPVVMLIILIMYGYVVPTSPVFGKVYYKGNCPEKVVALTFDDGPNEPYTSEILDILDSYKVKATFFVIGKNVELYPETAKRMIAEGHVLGNHSYSHNANHALTEYGAKDLAIAEEAIFNTVGVRPHLYRPPHGKKSPWELEEVKKQGLIEVTWSVSTGELNVTSPVSVAQKIVSETRPDEIILLHDGYGTSHNCSKSDKSLTVEALPLIIEKLQAEGYRFVTVPELLDVPAYND
ncbi:MAG: polysaccharide deacetylase family protein [Dehalococcoidia bacterium]